MSAVDRSWFSGRKDRVLGVIHPAGAIKPIFGQRRDPDMIMTLFLADVEDLEVILPGLREYGDSGLSAPGMVAGAEQGLHGLFCPMLVFDGFAAEELRHHEPLDLGGAERAPIAPRESCRAISPPSPACPFHSHQVRRSISVEYSIWMSSGGM